MDYLNHAGTAHNSHFFSIERYRNWCAVFNELLYSEIA